MPRGEEPRLWGQTFAASTLDVKAKHTQGCDALPLPFWWVTDQIRPQPIHLQLTQRSLGGKAHGGQQQQQGAWGSCPCPRKPLTFFSALGTYFPAGSSNQLQPTMSASTMNLEKW